MKALIDASDARWDSILGGVSHDIYHTAGYHRYSAWSDGGEAWMIALGNADRGIAWPYVLRTVGRVEGLHGVRARDVGSFLGYTGPVTWGLDTSDPWLGEAWEQVQDAWRSQGVVSVFTRFHPLLGNASLAERFPDASDAVGLTAGGVTVSIDCTLDDDEAVGQFSRVLRQEIAAARRANLVTRLDPQWDSLRDFVRLYRSTMARNGARPELAMSIRSVTRLRDELGGHLHLLVTRLDRTVVAAGLFTEYRGIVQALLVGVDDAYRRWSPLKVLLDDARRWAHRRGNRVLHLGGGRDGHEDTLFLFKSRFSTRRHRLYTGRCVVDPVAYRSLTEKRAISFGLAPRTMAESGWFPAYRTPLAPLESVAAA